MFWLFRHTKSTVSKFSLQGRGMTSGTDSRWTINHDQFFLHKPCIPYLVNNKQALDAQMECLKQKDYIYTYR